MLGRESEFKIFSTRKLSASRKLIKLPKKKKRDKKLESSYTTQIFLHIKHIVVAFCLLLPMKVSIPLSIMQFLLESITTRQMTLETLTTLFICDIKVQNLTLNYPPLACPALCL